MEFKAQVKAIKADIGKMEITLSFVMSLDEESLDEVQELAATVKDEDMNDVDLTVTPRQMALAGFKKAMKGRKVELTVQEGNDG